MRADSPHHHEKGECLCENPWLLHVCRAAGGDGTLTWQYHEHRRTTACSIRSTSASYTPPDPHQSTRLQPIRFSICVYYLGQVSLFCCYDDRDCQLLRWPWTVSHYCHLTGRGAHRRNHARRRAPAR